MYLAQTLGIDSADQIDPTRTLKIGPLELGTDAACEAQRILSESLVFEIEHRPRRFETSAYWSINHLTEGEAELFGFPDGVLDGLPTAIEVGLIRALAMTPPEHHHIILSGNSEIAIGPRIVWERFRSIFQVVEPPLSGKSVFFGGATQAKISDAPSYGLNSMYLSCLSNSFKTSPLKFRFLELYRIIENRFISDVKQKLIFSFDSEPSSSLREALESLKSEMSQIKGLAKNLADDFEACWLAIDQLKNSNNRFASAIFRRVAKKGEAAGPKSETGAALIYQIRCAVVHAGEKDLIFENFPDGDLVIESVIQNLENIALHLVGIDLS